MTASKLVLPAPEGPVNATDSPAEIRKSKSCKTRTEMPKESRTADSRTASDGIESGFMKFSVQSIASFCAAAIFCAAALSSAHAEDVVRIAAFGDSLSAGYGLPAKDGFAPALQKELREAGIAAEVYNEGVSGETSADGLLRVDWMLGRTSPDIVIVEFGANDMFRGMPAQRIEKNLAEIITRVQQSGARVLLAGMEAPRNYGPQYRRQLSEMYESLGDRFDAPLYPFFLEGVALDPSLNLSDGVHPNAAGVREIAKRIAPFVADLAEELQ